MTPDLELLNARDEARLWAVYADSLESRGDPRGALMSLMLSREAKPSRALADALTAQAGLLASLTPDSLQTLATRGLPRFAPVFRRGVMHSVGASEHSDFLAIAEHPSGALLDRLLLAVDDGAQLASWLGELRRPLPCRELELTVRDEGDLDLHALFAQLPWLERFTLDVVEPVDFPDCTTLREVRLRGADATLGDAKLPALTSVHLLLGRDRDPGALETRVRELSSRLRSLSELVLEGVVTDDVRAACLKSGARLTVRNTAFGHEDFGVPFAEGLETSFIVLRAPFTLERAQTLTHFAQLAGVTRLHVAERTVRVGTQPLTLLRLHGTGEAPLVPRVAL